MSHARRTIGQAAVPLVIALLLTACGGIGGGGKGVFQELLGTIPDTSETRQLVLINDFALARELFDVELPGPDADEEALKEYLIDLLDPRNTGLARGPWISGFTEYGMTILENEK